MKLFWAPGTCSLACWIALEWAGADYSEKLVDPHSDDYRNINPLATVPAIDIGAQHPRTQAGAILQYIAERYEDKNLGANAGLDARFEFNETMSFLTGDFHPAFWPYFSPQRYTNTQDDAALEAVRQASYVRVQRVLAHLDALIGDSGHVYGGKRSVADPYAFVLSRWSEKMPKSWRDYPNLAAFMQNMSTDKAVLRVLAKSKQ